MELYLLLESYDAASVIQYTSAFTVSTLPLVMKVLAELYHVLVVTEAVLKFSVAYWHIWQ